MPRLRRFSNIAINAGFAVLIGLPLVLFSGGSWTDPVEKRSSAPLPALPKNLPALRKFPAMFEAYFNDHFGLRAMLIDIRNRADLYLFKQSPTSRVLLGDSNWLFYTGDKAVEDYMGQQAFGPEALDAWYRALKERRDWLASQGIAYHFAVAPNKQSIYPEHMPPSIVRGTNSHLNQVIEYLARKGESSLVDDLRPALLAQKSALPLYHPIDAHWNPYGAYLAYRAIAEKINGTERHDIQTLDLAGTAFAPGDMRFGDLADMMGLHPYPMPVPTTGYVGPELPCQTHEVPANPALRWTDAARTQADMVSDCNLAGTGKRAVVFHDSMILAMRDYLASSFSHARFAWMVPSMNDIKRYVEAEHPDVVIEEQVERTLINIPRPVEAPTVVMASSSAPANRGGWADVANVVPGSVTIEGWGFWQPQDDRRKIVVDTNLSVDGTSVATTARPDVVEATKDDRLARSGFQLQLHLDPTKPRPDAIRLCVWTEDPVLGRHRLNYSDHREWDSCTAD